MVLTPFGKALRKLRIDKELTLHELALKMKLSAAFISAVETGRKPIPDGFTLAAQRAMKLTSSECKELRRAADQTRKEVRIDKLTSEQREVVAAFARGISDIDPDLLEKIKKAILSSIEGETPFKRNRRGMLVPPLSTRALWAHAEKIRSVLGKTDQVAFPIVEALEFGLPKLLPGFYLDIREAGEFGPLEGMVVAGKNAIALREDVYVAACRGEGRGRFTCCHELGHFLLHGSVAMARVCEDSDKVYCDSEWQADCFAGALMMSATRVSAWTNEYEAAKACGMSPAAARVMIEKYKAAGIE
jgi:transcriptional regulator with XRE-family HTH domain